MFGLLKELKYAMKICGIITNTVFAGFCVLGLYFYKLGWPDTEYFVIAYIDGSGNAPLYFRRLCLSIVLYLYVEGKK